MSKVVKGFFRSGFFLFIFLLSTIGFSQIPPNPDGEVDPVPITGIEILIGLGGLLGIKKISDLRKKR